MTQDRTATAERLRRVFHRLGGYPDWSAVTLQALRGFRDNMTANQIRSRLTGRELDAAWTTLAGRSLTALKLPSERPHLRQCRWTEISALLTELACQCGDDGAIRTGRIATANTRDAPTETCYRRPAATEQLPDWRQRFCWLYKVGGWHRVARESDVRFLPWCWASGNLGVSPEDGRYSCLRRKFCQLK